MNERRKTDRIPVANLPVYFRLNKNAHWIGPLFLINVSGHGLKFRVEEPIIQEKIELKFQLPEDKTAIEVDAKIVWQGKNEAKGFTETGVVFERMLQSDRKRFVAYICENLLNFYLDENGALKNVPS